MRKLLILILLGCNFFADAQIIRANNFYIKTNDVAPLPDTFSYILDSVTGAKQAYSFQKLRSAYTGNCIRVRRSNDNTEQNFGFLNNYLDTAALLTFVGANSGYIVMWYDQTANGLNATTSTTSRQPRIINAGVLERVNGKPAMYCDKYSGLDFTLQTYSDLTFLTVTKKLTTSPEWSVLLGTTTSNTYLAGDDVLDGGNPNLYASAGYAITGANTSSSGGEGALHLSYYNRVGSSCNGGLNGEVKTPTMTFSNGFVTNVLFQYFTGSSGYGYEGWVQQIIMYDSDKGSDRTKLETIINRFYTIY